MASRPDASFVELVLGILEDHPSGLAEFQMIKALRAGGRTELAELDSKLGLFRAHFLLFHVLYGLRERLWAERRGHLEISALCTRLLPYGRAPEEARRAAVVRSDPLRDYYMDLSNLDSTTEDDVRALLDGFWRRMAAGAGDPDHRREALEVLGLSDPVDYDTVRRRYRRLTMLHHPDRGGDTERLQRINAAMAVLANDFGR